MVKILEKFIADNHETIIIALTVPLVIGLISSIFVWGRNFFRKSHNRLRGKWFAYSLSTKIIESKPVEYIHVSECTFKNWLFLGFWVYAESSEWKYMGKLHINERNFTINWRGLLHPEKMFSAYRTPFKVNKETTILLGAKTCINTNCNPVSKFEILSKVQLSDEEILSYLKDKMFPINNPIIRD